MNGLLLNLLLALVWVMAVGRFTFHQLALGFALGFLVLAVVEPLWGSATYAPRVVRFLRFAVFFVRELVLSTLRIAYDVVTPRLRARPRIVALPLAARTDSEITLLASFLTLTPGTLSLDVSADRRTLYVHAMYAENREHFVTEVKQGLEARLLEVLR
jgi:multicomponent Na+:H+ antiporter subunit E